MVQFYFSFTTGYDVALFAFSRVSLTLPSDWVFNLSYVYLLMLVLVLNYGVNM